MLITFAKLLITPPKTPVFAQKNISTKFLVDIREQLKQKNFDVSNFFCIFALLKKMTGGISSVG